MTVVLKLIALSFLLIALVLGIWSGSVAGGAIGLTVFGLFAAVAALLFLIAHLNARVELRFAEIR